MITHIYRIIKQRDMQIGKQKCMYIPVEPDEKHLNHVYKSMSEYFPYTRMRHALVYKLTCPHAYI
jgi:hypothetical protein